MDTEPFRNERPGGTDTGPPYWISGFIGNNENNYSSDPTWENPYDDGSSDPVWQAKGSLNHLRRVKNVLMRHNGFLLRGTSSCLTVPPLLISGLPQEHQTHYSCLCFRWEGKLLQLKKSGAWYYHFLDIPLTGGIYTLSGKWQAGHYDYGEIYRVRIFLFGVDLGMVHLPLLKYATVAVITKSDGGLTVNNFKGSYLGNSRFVEKNQ